MATDNEQNGDKALTVIDPIAAELAGLKIGRIHTRLDVIAALKSLTRARLDGKVGTAAFKEAFTALRQIYDVMANEEKLKLGGTSEGFVGLLVTMSESAKQAENETRQTLRAVEKAATPSGTTEAPSAPPGPTTERRDDAPPVDARQIARVAN